MKNVNIFIKSVFDNYNPNNFDHDFLVSDVDNIVCIIDSNLTTKEIKKLANLISLFINKNYYKKNLTIFAWNKPKFDLFIKHFEIKERYSKFNIKVNTSRNSLVSSLSKISESELQNVLFITPSFNKQLYKTYLSKIDFNSFSILCLKSSLFKTINNSYRNYKIIKSLKLK